MQNRLRALQREALRAREGWRGLVEGGGFDQGFADPQDPDRCCVRSFEVRLACLTSNFAKKFLTLFGLKRLSAADCVRLQQTAPHSPALCNRLRRVPPHSATDCVRLRLIPARSVADCCCSLSLSLCTLRFSFFAKLKLEKLIINN